MERESKQMRRAHGAWIIEAGKGSGSQGSVAAVVDVAGVAIVVVRGLAFGAVVGVVVVNVKNFCWL